MNLQNRIDALSTLGEFIKNPTNNDQITEWAYRAHGQNNWFTNENVLEALYNIADGYLQKKSLIAFVHQYQLEDSPKVVKKVGLILAGNIPAVGFHDVLMVLLSGHECLVKLSSQDTYLMKALVGILQIADPNLKISFVDRLNDVDVLVATGSDNTFRYFEYYFRNIPHVIRQNRTSVGILTGKETADELLSLGKDITAYYGLGCRNVSKLYVPENYQFNFFYESIESLGDIFLHHKYKNNYDYNKSIYLVNGVAHLDNGFVLLKESNDLVSPISVLFYETYKDEADLKQKIGQNKHKIQCIVSKNAWFENSFVFGNSQVPSLYDFADGFDTLSFLKEL